MIDRPFLSQFSPQRTDPEALEQILVQRHDLLAESVARVRESVLTANKHHLLFIGPRGAGKTHLITLIHHRLRKQPDVGKAARIAWLNEDETATSFLKLLILIYRDLTKRYPAEFPASDLQSVYGMKPDIARETLGASLLRHLGPHTIVLLVENLDSLFKDMPEVEQRTWRAFVQNHPVFATVGTAQSLFSGVSDRDEPFFGFFDTRHLDALTVDEAVTLLKNIARLNKRDDLLDFLGTPTGHARVQAIHDLAGGNPRLYIIFSDFLTRESLNDLVRPFEETADRQLTTYYQERLRWLSAQQREIIQLLCHHPHPIPVKAIAEGLFTTHSTITNQLKLLREMRYLRFHERGREVLYELAEPLMRLSLQVKETHDRRPLSLIVDFLRVWYDRRDLEQRLGNLDAASPIRAYFEEALARLDSGEPNLRHRLLRAGLGELDPLHCDDSALTRLWCLANETKDQFDLSWVAIALMARGKTAEAINVMDEILNLPDLLGGIVALVLPLRGLAYARSMRVEESITDLTRTIDMESQCPLNIGWPLLFRGYMYAEVSKWDFALADFKRLYSIPNHPAAFGPIADELPHRVVEAIFGHTTETPQWSIKITGFFDHVVRCKVLVQVGEALIQHLPKLAASPLNHAAYDTWADAWASASETLAFEDRQRLEIPLRLLRTGIAYLKNKDEGRLLVLPSEERKILREALKLPPERIS